MTKCKKRKNRKICKKFKRDRRIVGGEETEEIRPFMAAIMVKSQFNFKSSKKERGKKGSQSKKRPGRVQRMRKRRSQKRNKKLQKCKLKRGKKVGKGKRKCQGKKKN